MEKTTPVAIAEEQDISLVKDTVIDLEEFKKRKDEKNLGEWMEYLDR